MASCLKHEILNAETASKVKMEIKVETTVEMGKMGTLVETKVGTVETLVGSVASRVAEVGKVAEEDPQTVKVVRVVRVDKARRVVKVNRVDKDSRVDKEDKEDRADKASKVVRVNKVVKVNKVAEARMVREPTVVPLRKDKDNVAAILQPKEEILVLRKQLLLELELSGPDALKEKWRSYNVCPCAASQVAGTLSLRAISTSSTQL